MAGKNPTSTSLNPSNGEVLELTSPQPICDHVKHCMWGQPFTKEDGIELMKMEHADEFFVDFKIRRDCEDCETFCLYVPELMLICAFLKCEYLACEDRNHWKCHYESTGHCVVYSWKTRTLCCHKCRCYVHVDVLKSPPLSPVPEAAPPEIDLQSLFEVRGLYNSDGRSCFANVIIQVLLHTSHLRQYFENEPKIECREAHKAGKRCLITPVFDLFQEYFNGRKEPLQLEGLLRRFWLNMPELGGKQQEDAHEFLTGLLDWIHIHFQPDPVKDDASYGVSVTDKVFGGKLQSTVTCQVCWIERIQMERFWNVSLELPDPTANGITLEELLGFYTQLETMECWTECPICNRRTKSTKQLQFRYLPPVLCFHVKRFQQTVEGGITKIRTHVQFPENLDLAPFMSKDAKVDRDADSTSRSLPLKKRNVVEKTVPGYHLYGVVVHRGSSNIRGHYVCYIRFRQNNNSFAWFEVNDKSVRQVSSETVHQAEAYLLFYQTDKQYRILGSEE